MACTAAPPLPIPHDQHEDHDRSPRRVRLAGRRCGARVRGSETAGRGSKPAASPTRGMAIVMGIASVLALTLAMLQLAEGQTGKTAAQTLYIAAGFNVLFTLLYAPLMAVFTLRTGFFKAIGTLVSTFVSGLAYTLGLLFVSAVVLVGLASVFG